MTVDEAARHLGLTVDAVRKRVQRGQIAHEKDAAGRVRIILDNSETLQDESPDTTGLASELVEELRVRIAYLERQVEEEREARRRADTILAQLSRANEEQARTIRAIEAPDSGATEPREAPERGTDEQQGRGPIPEDTSPQTPSERPDSEAPRQGPWWRRMFGG